MFSYNNDKIYAGVSPEGTSAAVWSGTEGCGVTSSSGWVMGSGVGVSEICFNLVVALIQNYRALLYEYSNEPLHIFL